MAGKYSFFANAKHPELNYSTFEIAVEAPVLEDLRLRLERTRWNDSVQDGWAYGTDRNFLRSLIDYWTREYQWNARQQLMNQLPLCRAVIDGFHVNFLYHRGKSDHALPIVLMNGWPSSFIEYAKLVPLLTGSQSSGAGEMTFDLVIPSLPGFGFSERATQPHQVDSVELFFKLMRDVLGYNRFLAVGTDIGAGVATRMALKYPDAIAGIHITSVVDPPGAEKSPTLLAAEEAYLQQCEKWNREEGAYESLQCTRPQTLAFGLADSPVGLASWIVEKFYNWTDCPDGLTTIFPMETLLDNIMIYWVTGTIGSSVRYYYESRHFRAPLLPDQQVSVPTAVMVLPKDLVQPPREWTARFYNVQRFTVADRGGHFPAWEIPDHYAQEIRSFAHQLHIQ